MYKLISTFLQRKKDPVPNQFLATGVSSLPLRKSSEDCAKESAERGRHARGRAGQVSGRAEADIALPGVYRACMLACPPARPLAHPLPRTRIAVAVAASKASAPY